jgi:hypothetical protein
MSVHALKSNFGKVTRGVALALAMTGGASVALAQESPTPAQPDAAAPQVTEQVGLPAGCLPVKNLDRDVGPNTGVLKQFAEALKAYSGYTDLTNGLEDAGIVIDGYCAAVYPPQQAGGVVRLDKEGTYTSLDLNVTAMKDMGNGRVAVMAASPEMITGQLEPLFLPEAVKTMSELTARYVSKVTDDMDSTVLLRTVIQANAIAEESLFAVDMYDRTGSDKPLQHLLGAENLALYSDEITNLWTEAVDHQADGSTLTKAEKDAFRVAVVTKALNDPGTRQAMYDGMKQLILGMVTHGMVNPSIAFNTHLDAANLAERVRLLHPAFANLDLDAISTALKANAADPSVKANAELNDTLKKFQDFIKSMGAQQDGQPAESAPAPTL